MPQETNNARQFAKPEIRVEAGRAALFVDGRHVPPMAYTASWRMSERHARQLTGAGLELFFLWVDSGWHSLKNETTWRQLNEETQFILKYNPNALFVLRTACHPDFGWLDENPDDLATFEDGRTDHFKEAWVNYFGDDIYSMTGHSRMVCLASQHFAQVCSKHLCKLVDRVEQSAFGPRVIGYFLVGGGTGEWYTPGIYDSDKHCLGYSPSFLKAYGDFLRRKYGCEEKLRRVWRDTDASFDQPRIPTKDERLLSVTEFPRDGRVFTQADCGNFLDPQKNQCLIDFYEARSACTAATIETFCQSLKEKTNGRVLTGAFGGNYGCTYYHLNSVTFMTCLYDSPHVDFLCSPSNYEDRTPGGSGGGIRAPLDSMHYRGKLWINECDSRTFKADTYYLVETQGMDKSESLETLKRDFAYILCNDIHAFWFDMQAGEFSFYDDPDILALFRKQQALAEENTRSDARNASEIAFVYDQDSVWLVDQETTKDLASYNGIFNLIRIGAPCDHIHQDDLDLDTLPDYKVYIFLNCFHLDNAERERIARQVKRDGKTAVWVYASGLCNPDSETVLDVTHMSDLTGFQFGSDAGPCEPTFRIDNIDHALTGALSPHLLYGRYDRPLLGFLDWTFGEIQVIHPSLHAPLFYVDDPEATPLGTFVTNGKTAFAVKQFETWQSIYVGSKVLNAAVLRQIIKTAGVHLYLDTDDVFYANKRFIAIHATQEGRKEICLPQTVHRVTDAYTDEVLAENTDRIELDISFGHTCMLRLE
jgi:ATP-dependent Clp protease adapter protein ClpS